MKTIGKIGVGVGIGFGVLLTGGVVGALVTDGEGIAEPAPTIVATAPETSPEPSATPEPTPEPEPVPEATQEPMLAPEDVLEDAFLDTIMEVAPELYMSADDADLIAGAKEICAYMDSGVGFDELFLELYADGTVTDENAHDFGALVGAGVVAFCPQHSGELGLTP